MVRQVVASVVVYGSHLSQISQSRVSYSELSPYRGRRGCRLPVSPPGVEAGCPSPRAQLACRARCPSRHPARADGKARLGEEAVRWRTMKLRARKDGERSEGDMKRRTPATATKSTQEAAQAVGHSDLPTFLIFIRFVLCFILVRLSAHPLPTIINVMGIGKSYGDLKLWGKWVGCGLKLSLHNKKQL
ncbi:uncharacterized protein LOC124703817 [Lolium rigidum]|uniref:uncharacterized protein LOC124703817 n=1 Tax=Lolium rigidum TaxID=89674 RepID=UPI001F5E02D3|nr:uncharacterized protein LOC124703817 [Lolium rigidum]